MIVVLLCFYNRCHVRPILYPKDSNISHTYRKPRESFQRINREIEIGHCCIRTVSIPLKRILYIYTTLYIEEAVLA